MSVFVVCMRWNVQWPCVIPGRELRISARTVGLRCMMRSKVVMVFKDWVLRIFICQVYQIFILESGLSVTQRLI
jgi:hypothetical protein